jgi:hypothetical protein
VRFSSHSVLFLVIGSLAFAAANAQESNPAVEQSRLFPRTLPPSGANVTADGIALPEGETTASSDESFGAQQVIKRQEKVPDFFLSGAASLYYTSNVALTRSDTKSDGFFVGEAAFSWTPRLNPQLQFQLGGGASIFRYFETSALDFENLGVGSGFTWTPPHAWGLALFGRYDFSELLDKHSDQILQDHEFSFGVQKIVPLGRSHALSFGLIGSAGISDPFAEQRDQVGLAVGYHLQLARQFGADLGYRLSGYFYNDGGRDDLNQVLSLGMRYNIRPWASVNAFLSGATNASNRSAFRYDVFSCGGSLGLTIRF